jgi:hypothetical protein
MVIKFADNQYLLRASLICKLSGVSGYRRQKVAKAAMKHNNSMIRKVGADPNKVSSHLLHQVGLAYGPLVRWLDKKYSHQLNDLFSEQLKILGLSRPPYQCIRVFADPFYNKNGFIIDLRGRQKWVVTSIESGLIWENIAHEIFHLLVRKLNRFSRWDLDKNDLPVSSSYINESDKIKLEEYWVRALTILLFSQGKDRRERISRQVRYGFTRMPEFVGALSSKK